MQSKQNIGGPPVSNVLKMEGQLKTWTTRLDELFAKAIEAGAQGHDPYQVRLDDLRARQLEVQTKLNIYNNPEGKAESWTSFRSSVADDWTALEIGFKDLTR